MASTISFFQHPTFLAAAFKSGVCSKCPAPPPHIASTHHLTLGFPTGLPPPKHADVKTSLDTKTSHLYLAVSSGAKMLKVQPHHTIVNLLQSNSTQALRLRRRMYFLRIFPSNESLILTAFYERVHVSLPYRELLQIRFQLHYSKSPASGTMFILR
jgi:hypothetical protein